MTAIHMQPVRDCAHTVSRHAGIEALNDTTTWILGNLREWRRRIQERRELASLSERTLADIGVSRADADFLSNKPFWRE
ncbi:MAG TPA: DUF1127 domain-containing protein [Stellaceae bacterium]|jgi:uncharacterized protein YjiS (DUF1127 family)|nr:DUF1127 domain-containing protein [Stellaceae bacterium]